MEKLTSKIAKQLVRRELGLSPKTLRKDTHVPFDACIFEMTAGSLNIAVSNEWFNECDTFKLEISTTVGDGNIVMFFDPKTLDHNWDAADEYQFQQMKRRCAGCRYA